MKKYLLFSIGTAAAILTIGTLAVSASQERVWHVFEHPPMPPETFAERIQAADLVIAGNVESRQVDGRFPPTAKAPVLTTTYAVVVADVIKAPVSGIPRGARIRVFRHGGEMKSNGEVLRVINESLPELTPGEYVLFLRSRPQRQGYEVMWAADGVFALGTSIRSPGWSKLSQSVQLLTRDSFLEQLRIAFKSGR